MTRIVMMVVLALGLSVVTAAQTGGSRKTPAAQLEALPGIGKAMAERIVEYRQKNGSFKKVEENPDLLDAVRVSGRSREKGQSQLGAAVSGRR